MRILFELSHDIEQPYITPLTIADAIVNSPQVNRNPNMIEAIAHNLLTEAIYIRKQELEEECKGEEYESAN